MKRYLGCSGWNYKDWKNRFYPKGISGKDMLPYYCNHFNTVEINNTFYRLPPKKTFVSWNERSPVNFRFSVKGSSYVTHLKKLKNIDDSVKQFYDHVSLLEDKLGCVLWQLPPNLHLDTDRLISFCETLSKHFKNVIEFRHLSWFTSEVYDILHKRDINFCMISAPGFEEDIRLTGDVGYVRFHGKNRSNWYKYDYSQDELRFWANGMQQLKCRELYIYFNNDYNANSVNNATTLKQIFNE